MNVWQNAPYVAILLLAGLRSLPSEPLEAASIDGASRLQMFWHVTLPLLQPYILVALLLRTIFEFRAFDNVYVMTSGGPADATMVLSMFTYMASFVRFDLSLGPAASWVMLLISLLLCLLFVAVIRRKGAPAEGCCLRGGRAGGWRLTRACLCGLLVMMVVFLFPLLWVVGLSFKTRLQVFANPPLFIWQPTIENYIAVMRARRFLQAFVNSLAVSAGAVVLSL